MTTHSFLYIPLLILIVNSCRYIYPVTDKDKIDLARLTLQHKEAKVLDKQYAHSKVIFTTKNIKREWIKSFVGNYYMIMSEDSALAKCRDEGGFSVESFKSFERKNDGGVEVVLEEQYCSSAEVKKKYSRIAGSEILLRIGYHRMGDSWIADSIVHLTFFD